MSPVVTRPIPFLLVGIWLALVAALEGPPLRRSAQIREAAAFWTAWALSGALALLEISGRGPVGITRAVDALFSPAADWVRSWLGA